MRTGTALAAAVLVVAATAGTAALANTITGPSSSDTPYVVRSLPGVVTRSILTVGDSVNAKPDGTPYRMVGIPDGLALGKFSWENSVASPSAGAATIVAGTDDSTPGEVYLYVGQKKASRNPAVRAGLTGGTLFGVRVAGFPTEPAGGIPSGTPFTLANLGNREASSGATLQADSTAAGVTRFLRPEDAAWDTTDPSRLYFVTTNGFDQPSRLWRLDFADLANPAAGGTIELLLEGPEGGHQMFDNMTVNDRGHVLIQEDPGNQPYLARIWRYATDAELVEGGQLFALHVPPGKG